MAINGVTNFTCQWMYCKSYKNTYCIWTYTFDVETRISTLVWFFQVFRQNSCTLKALKIGYLSCLKTYYHDLIEVNVSSENRAVSRSYRNFVRQSFDVSVIQSIIQGHQGLEWRQWPMENTCHLLKQSGRPKIADSWHVKLLLSPLPCLTLRINRFLN